MRCSTNNAVQNSTERFQNIGDKSFQIPTSTCSREEGVFKKYDL